MTTRVLAFAGSMRKDSRNRRLLAAATALAPADIEVVTYEGLAVIPPFNEDHETDLVPATVVHWRDAIMSADAMLIATPEYNGSIPGQLKNALDWASRPYGACVLTGKAVATCSVSPSSYGAAWAQADLRKVLKQCGAAVVGDELIVPSAHTCFDDEGKLNATSVADALRDRLARLSRFCDGPIATASV